MGWNGIFRFMWFMSDRKDAASYIEYAYKKWKQRESCIQDISERLSEMCLSLLLENPVSKKADCHDSSIRFSYFVEHNKKKENHLKRATDGVQ
jgi:hypothetical protein